MIRQNCHAIPFASDSVGVSSKGTAVQSDKEVYHGQECDV